MRRLALLFSSSGSDKCTNEEPFSVMVENYIRLSYNLDKPKTNINDSSYPTLEHLSYEIEHETYAQIA